jgi:Peptidase propeptide and YPEB domain
MKTKNFILILLVSSLLLAPLSLAGANDLPPMGSKPLSIILRSVEEQKLGVIREAEFDHGLWEVDVCDAGACQELSIDPMSGKEKGRRKSDLGEIPPANAMPISKIVQSIEARRLGVIEEIELEHGFWEIELRKEGRKIKLAVDPNTGQTRP